MTDLYVVTSFYQPTPIRTPLTKTYGPYDDVYAAKQVQRRVRFAVPADRVLRTHVAVTKLRSE